MTPSSPEPTGAAGHAGPADLVISGCTVLVHDDRGRIGFERTRPSSYAAESSTP